MLMFFLIQLEHKQGFHDAKMHKITINMGTITINTEN